MAGVTILTVTDLEKRYISDLIFSGLTFQVGEGEHIGIVGPNGVGKSTLLKIVAGIEPTSGGTVAPLRGLKITYLAQEARFDSDRDVREETLQAFAHLHTLRDQMTAIEQALATTTDDAELERLMADYDAASVAFETGGGYDTEHRAEAVLHGLGFDETNWHMQVRTLSGGQKTRVALAKALLEAPDLLLLDEPTNHLDLAALEWLEGFLMNHHGAFIVVSHDRYFLDRVTKRTIDLAFGRLEDYPAPYGRYLTLREERMARRLKEYEEQQAFILRTEEFIRKYKAGQRSKEARGRATRLARLERLERPQESERLRLAMASDLRSGRVVLGTDKVRVGYTNGGQTTELMRTPDLEVQRGDRVALIGPNGGGKTTFLRTLMGEIQPLAGKFYFGTNVRPAYYAQGHEQLELGRTVIETIQETHPMLEEAARTLLGRFLFSDDDVFKSVAALSGGERSRLALAKLTLARSNFLILDEPTNHLDIAAREALESVLDEYDGTLLIVSHDRYFIDRLATQVWAIGEDRLIRPYIGNYTEYVRESAKADKTERRDGARAKSLAITKEPKQEANPPAPAQREPEPARANGATPAGGKARGGDERRVRERQKQLAEAEKQISAWEARLNGLSAEMAAAGGGGQLDRLTALSQEYDRLHEQLEGLYGRWTQLTAELDEMTLVDAS